MRSPAPLDKTRKHVNIAKARLADCPGDTLHPLAESWPAYKEVEPDLEFQFSSRRGPPKTEDSPRITNSDVDGWYYVQPSLANLVDTLIQAPS